MVAKINSQLDKEARQIAKVLLEKGFFPNEKALLSTAIKYLLRGDSKYRRYLAKESYVHDLTYPLKGEKWRSLPELGEYYQISDKGRVLSTKRGYPKIIKLSVIQRGYLQAPLMIEGKKRFFMVHRLVATAFLKNPHNRAEVNHKNGVKHDNRVKNLEWMSSRENNNHAIKANLRTQEKRK